MVIWDIGWLQTLVGYAVVTCSSSNQVQGMVDSNITHSYSCIPDVTHGQSILLSPPLAALPSNTDSDTIDRLVIMIMMMMIWVVHTCVVVV